MLRVRVRERAATRARGGHPWIYRADVLDEAPAGAAVVVTDERGRALGSALACAPGRAGGRPAAAAIALRVYATGAEPVEFDERLIADRLTRALARRRELLGETVACRLVHAEADGLPGLFVDRYADALVLQAATTAIDSREGLIARVLAASTGARVVVARDDGSTRDAEDLPRRKGVLHGGGPTVVEVAEGRARFVVDLLEDHKTGGFLDQRDNHLRAGALARGRALDAFSYHGGFALALAARAESVIALEVDAAAAARAAENARRSGLTNVEVRQADAFAALRAEEAAGHRYDIIVVDPPALAKRQGSVDAALRAYRELNLRAMRLLAEDGWLVTCSCSGRVTRELFGQVLVEAARDARRQAVIVERRGAGPDHPVLVGVPETEYLKCWILQLR